MHGFARDAKWSLILTLTTIIGLGGWEFLTFSTFYGVPLGVLLLYFDQSTRLARIRDTTEIKGNGLWSSGFNICDILQITAFEKVSVDTPVYTVSVVRRVMQVKWCMVWFDTRESKFVVYLSKEGNWRCQTTHEYFRYPIKNILKELYKRDNNKLSGEEYDYKN